MNKSKKGFIGFYILFIFFTIVLLFIVAMAVPMSIRINSELTASGARIINNSMDTINQIDNAEIRTELTSALTDAVSASAQNIEIQAALFQYSWVIFLVIGALLIFLMSRQLVEYQRGGGLV